MPTRVLIVDDAVFMREMIKDIFADGEFEVVGEAVHGVEHERDLLHDVRVGDALVTQELGGAGHQLVVDALLDLLVEQRVVGRQRDELLDPELLGGVDVAGVEPERGAGLGGL